MKQDVAEISASRLDQRLSADRFPNELADLGATLNGMLSRLDNSFSRLSNFSSDIAHELRTPLTNLMTQTQVALSKARSTDEYQDILASNAEELERMARMIADMLFLAQSDNGLMLLQTGSVFLAQEFRELGEFYDALLEEKSITLNIVGEAEIQGDKLMLRRAFSNLLSNAIRHTPAGGKISVTITQPDDKVACVEICNPGDIPKEHLPHLFERFYRVDPSRHRDGESTGLGLAITRSILAAHHGAIEATSEQGKVRFKILF
jgi:two-component system heavy metal sensor histidine kinase CusS